MNSLGGKDGNEGKSFQRPWPGRLHFNASQELPGLRLGTDQVVEGLGFKLCNVMIFEFQEMREGEGLAL